ncbi:hypothetical protein [Actinomadura yumaensis]|uniref:PH domain-containing protein n=1 Tax=Actinomadura yumaensis TaxID=111807 RepID=A0ABW2CNG7_9ACTN
MATPSRPALTTLSVRYNPPVAWGALALGVLNLLLGLLAPGPLINVILGVLFIVLGVIFFVRTYFTYSAAGRTLEVTAPIGARRSFRASGGDTLVVEGGRIVLVRADGRRKKLPVARWMSRRREWDAVVEAIGS